MAFSDMNDVEQELGEEKPPEKNGNRTFLIFAGILGGIMVVALLCIAGLALLKLLPSQQAALDQNATKAAQDTAAALAVTATPSEPTLTATRQPTFTPTKTEAPTNTPVLVIVPTKSPTIDVAIATRYALLTQTAVHAFVTTTSSAPTLATTPHPTSTALPGTGFADEFGTPGLLVAAFVLIVLIFVVRGLRTAS